MGLLNPLKKDMNILLNEELATQMAEKVLSIMKETEKPSIKINISEEETSLTDSKFGGLPYLPYNTDIPKDKNGEHLHILAQINISQLPSNSFPVSEGILQFWIANDDALGLDFENPLSQTGSRVIYYDKIENHLSENELYEKYPFLFEKPEHFPVEYTFKLSFDLSKEIISACDYSFSEKFKNAWNKIFTSYKINNVYDLPEYILDNIYYKSNGFGHKLLGYPGFTQEDPRSYGNYNDYILLFQIDSLGTKKHHIMWGDSGICNFFIKEEDLKNLNFSKVLYNWDCY